MEGAIPPVFLQKLDTTVVAALVDGIADGRVVGGPCGAGFNEGDFDGKSDGSPVVVP